MQDFPHHYRTSASARHDSNVDLTSPGLPNLPAAAPAEFGGPGDHWSPETLLAAAVASCFKLSFKAIARAAKFEWVSIRCDVVAVLDLVDKVTFREENERVLRGKGRLASHAKADQGRR